MKTIETPYLNKNEAVVTQIILSLISATLNPAENTKTSQILLESFQKEVIQTVTQK